MFMLEPMKKQNKLFFLLVAGGLFLGSVAASEAVADDMPSREEMWKIIQRQQRAIDLLESRLSEMQENVQVQAVSTEKSPADEPLLENISLSGVVEVEASQSEDYAGVDASDIALATAELTVDGTVNRWVNGQMVLLYDDPNNSNLTVDAATITLGDTEEFPTYLTVGRMTTPFGNYSTNLISDPLTLELGETGGEDVVQVGFEINGLQGAIYAFNGSVNETGSEDTIEQLGGYLGYAMDMEEDRFGLEVGLSFTNSIDDSDGLSGAAAGPVSEHIHGLGAHGMVTFSGITLIGEYVGATDDYRLAEMAFNGRGASPDAWNAELGYTFQLNDRETTLAVQYQETSEALALALPEKRISLGASMNLFENTALAIEWKHDDDYGLGDGGTGNEADTGTMQLAVGF